MAVQLSEPDIVEGDEAVSRINALGSVTVAGPVSHTHRGWFVDLMQRRRWGLWFFSWTTTRYVRMSLAVWPRGIAGICHELTGGAMALDARSQTITKYTLWHIAAPGADAGKVHWRGESFEGALRHLA